jgi:16S rRNA (cytidine1402-2'-O)-methyltransferase
MDKGKIFMLPIPIVVERIDTIPPQTIFTTHKLQHFIVEKAKIARAYLKAIKHPSENFNLEIDKYLSDTVMQGKDIGIMSDAGCPGIADPGARIIGIAHRKGITVSAKVGPSSILLALMASGFNGQKFTFHGYLSNKKPDLIKELRAIEKDMSRTECSHIFIETPYRNGFMIETILEVLNPNTELSVSIDINSETEENIRLPLLKWKKMDVNRFHKRPAVFVIGKNI